MCDRLYFDELTFERVMDIIEMEQPHGVIVSTGGQIPNNLAMHLDAQNVPILGTAAKDIDNAEDRAKFSQMLTNNGINQPEWSALTSMEDIDNFIERVGFPVLVRPSYVLSGAAMNVCSNEEELKRFLQLAANVSEDHPVVVSKFIEHAKEIEMEQPHGVIVSTGGQIPNNLAMRLDAQNVPILGTAAKDIDNAEDRAKFSQMLTNNGINQPEWSALTSMEDIDKFIERVGFPVLVRPSYVLSGAAMNVCSNEDELKRFLQLAANVSEDHPVVVSKFLEHAKEIEMDAVAKNGEVIAYAISEHIEFAGVHSGDATIQFPPQKLYVETVRRVKRVGRQIAKELHINGPFNIQFMARDNDILVIECNLRASRSFPFVSKVLKINLIELATRVMLGLPVEKPHKNLFDLDYVGIKASQFSFNRLQKADPVLGVDMSSTGEVGCLGDDTSTALLKSMLSVGHRIPAKNILLSTGSAKQKVDMLDAAHMLIDHGYKLYATGGTSKFLTENGVENTRVLWPSEEAEGGAPKALEMLHNHEIDMVVNIPKNLTSSELSNGYKIRRAAIDLNVPLITNSRLASAFIYAFCTTKLEDIDIKAWGEYK